MNIFTPNNPLKDLQDVNLQIDVRTETLSSIETEIKTANKNLSVLSNDVEQKELRRSELVQILANLDKQVEDLKIVIEEKTKEFNDYSAKVIKAKKEYEDVSNKAAEIDAKTRAGKEALDLETAVIAKRESALSKAEDKLTIEKEELASKISKLKEIIK